MMTVFYPLLRFIKRNLWAIMVAYMVGIHNFYKGEDKTTDNIGITIELNEAQEDGTPKN